MEVRVEAAVAAAVAAAGGSHHALETARTGPFWPNEGSAGGQATIGGTTRMSPYETL